MTLTTVKPAGFIAWIDLANMCAPKIDIEWRTASRVAREDRERPPASREKIEKRSRYWDEMIRHAQEQKQENAGEA